MPKTAIFIGLVMVVVSVVTYFGSGTKSPTAFIPAGVGAVLAVMGVVGLKPDARKGAMHGAAAWALLGFLAGAGRLFGALVSDKPVSGWAVTATALMALLCGVFVMLAVFSFLATRRKTANPV